MMRLNKNKLSVWALCGALLVMAGCATQPTSEPATDEESGLLEDVRIERALLRNLASTPQLVGEPITVNVVNGEATLIGTVRSSVEREMAEQVARSSEGVTRVRNNLKTN